MGGATTIGACVGDDPTTGGVLPDASADTGAADDLGRACTVGTSCRSGLCVDGVCCDSKCDGICERCNLPGRAGQCAPIDDGQDPDKECPTAPLPTEPVEDAGVADLDADAAIDLDAALANDGAPSFDLPEAGLPPGDGSRCAGRCNGKRACAYAGSETTCGEAFCGNSTTEGRASCDGQGHCLYQQKECSAFSCPNGSKGCRETCSAPSDCLAGFYCDGTSKVCKRRNGNGTACGKGIECETGYCIDGVCCNSDCSTLGGSCAIPGKEGQCQCSACDAGPCAVFYRDDDGDTYGDKYATKDNGRIQLGCAGSPPAGFSVNNLDCWDFASANAKKVHPGASGSVLAYKDPVSGLDSWDYNCDGVETKEIREDTASPACHYCSSSTRIGGQGLVTIPIFSSCEVASTCSAAFTTAGHSCDSKCKVDNTPVFETIVKCGAAGTLYTCGSCAAKGGSASHVSQGLTQQPCH